MKPERIIVAVLGLGTTLMLSGAVLHNNSIATAGAALLAIIMFPAVAIAIFIFGYLLISKVCRGNSKED